jgi:hypothetical protein
MNVLGKIILVSLCMFTSLRGGSFKKEEWIFIDAVNRIDDDSGIEGSKDFFFYQTKVYGDYFGPKAIERTIELYFKMNSKQRGELPFVKESLIRWGRRTTMTVAAISSSLSVDEKATLEDLCKTIETPKKWEDLKKSQEFNTVAGNWYSKDVVDVGNENKSSAIIKKIVYQEEGGKGKLVVDMGSGDEVVFFGRAVTTEQGGVCALEENFFVSDFAGVTKGGGWEVLARLNLMSSGTVVSWKRDKTERILQLVKGRNIEGGCDYYIILREGRGSVFVGKNLNGLSKEDVSILAIRAKTIVDNYARRLVYKGNLTEDFRLSRWISGEKFIEKIDAENLEVMDSIEFLIMNAKRLPISGELRYKEYNEIIRFYK